MVDTCGFVRSEKNEATYRSRSIQCYRLIELNWLVFFAFYCAGAAHGSHPNLRTTSTISLKLRPHCHFYKLPLPLTTTDYRLPQDGWIVVNYFMRMKFTANKVTITLFFILFSPA